MACHRCSLLLLYVTVVFHGHTAAQGGGGDLANIAACDSEIYCSGRLLEAAQNAHVFNDSKTFVDMKMKSEGDEILRAFDTLAAGGANLSSAEVMRGFLDQWFDPPGSEFEVWQPTDWRDSPEFLNHVADSSLREWGRHVHQLWKSLGRNIKPDVRARPHLYSLLYVPHPVIVPGGRFREFYYWDTYWIIRGLLLSEMTETTRGMLSNFAEMVKRFGFVPNGGRVYYSRRSQPPVLTLAVRDYLDKTNDTVFVQTVMPQLEMEYNFWMRDRNVTVRGRDNGQHVLNQYRSFIGKSRPESWREDEDAARSLETGTDPAEFHANVASACESGWDFSSRWYAHGDDVTSIRTTDIIPVDLNVFMCACEAALANMSLRLGRGEAAAQYQAAVERRRAAIDAVLWSDQQGVWLDYNSATGQHTDRFYASNIFPLYNTCYGDGTAQADIEGRVVDYLKKESVLIYPGGVPTSRVPSGEQWDFPNGWPPLQHLVIESLAASPVREAQRLAQDLAQRWINTNYGQFVRTRAMWEKYDVETGDHPGSGGEYDVQVGFGWTNGVVLHLLDKYGHILRAPPASTAAAPVLHMVPLILSLTAAVITGQV
ncbi:trehalase-like [Branchiostoma lanceolatum]|uniref:trehalase-like n=1 Tax=Branchiostoma lanceolatum TaxID=7740 RepID=UPI003453562A